MTSYKSLHPASTAPPFDECREQGGACSSDEINKHGMFSWSSCFIVSYLVILNGINVEINIYNVGKLSCSVYFNVEIKFCNFLQALLSSGRSPEGRPWADGGGGRSQRRPKLPTEISEGLTQADS